MSYDSSLQVLPTPVTTPAGPGWNSQSLSLVTPSSGERLNGGAVVGVNKGGAYWKIQLSYNGGTPSAYAGIFAVLNSLTVYNTKFYVSLPYMTEPASGAWGSGTGTNAGRGLLSKISTNTIRVSNKSQLAGTLEVGDMIKLSTGSKIYTVQAVIEGTSTIDFVLNSMIVSTVDGLTYLQPDNIKFKVVVNGSLPSYRINTSGLVEGFSLDLEESVEDE